MTRHQDKHPHDRHPHPPNQPHHAEADKNVKNALEIALERAAAMGHVEAPHGDGKPPEASIPQAELEALREKAAKADENYDRLLRTAADFDNYRKRVERERADLLKYGRDEIISDLIAVLDNFERALAAAGTASDASRLAEGVGLIRKQLMDTLHKYGLTPIEALGKPFDPQFHEAVAEAPTDEHPDGAVVAEHLKGYMLHDRLLRPSVVTVATAPGEAVPAGPGEEGSQA